ncbi:hypothetical protein [Pedobacter sp. AJM]|uniref:hypothetical protein n=1 Tax=Pedobacter sp. AJM TaxID=2003629 RepID=UPI000B4AAE55|nr:hypothetical protein [Pedobacter sp. AJM]OWK71424.1 hypothetical protein CBW18_10225 [Pedobacter sp. AJM]
MITTLKEQARWKVIRTKLNKNYHFSTFWEDAIQLFHERIDAKYFAPIKAIIGKRTLKGEGFAIVTVQCAMIEMFAAFRSGLIFNHDRANKASKYEYHKSQVLFTDFLKTAPLFENHFFSRNANGVCLTDYPFNAANFYSDVRCGLMHEARTKGNWHISAAPRGTSVKTAKQFIIFREGKIKLLRMVLHYRLLNYLTAYQAELRTQNRNGEILRKKFARKMDHLFDFAPDQLYDWWN